MGIDGSKNLLWKASSVGLESMKAMDLGRCIDVDCNLLACKLALKLMKGRKCHTEGLATAIASHLKILAHNCGFVVTVIFDGDIRPDCKRASWNRRKKRHLNRINSIKCRLKAVETSNSGLTDESKNYNDECSKLERTLSNEVPVLDLTFKRILEDELLKIGASTTI